MSRRSARYYDKIYAAAGKDYAAEAQAIRELLVASGIAEGMRLLDVACGTGAHLQYLRQWFDSEGLDIDEEMLRQAARRCPGIPLHRADMIDFSLPRPYDAITCLFSAIGYAKRLDDMRRATANMARHLRPNGVLVMEPWLTPDIIKPPPHIDATYVDEPELKLARMTTLEVDHGITRLDMHYLVCTPAGTEYLRERYELGLYTRDQYAAALRDAGLEVTFDSQGPMGRGLYTGIKRSASEGP